MNFIADFLTSFEDIPAHFLSAHFPALGAVMRPVAIALCTLYVGWYAARAHAGQVAFTPVEITRRVVTVALIFMALSWDRLGGPLYHALVNTMDSLAGSAIGGRPVASALDGIADAFLKPANEALSAGIGSLGVVLVGAALMVATVVLLGIGVGFILLAKLMLALTLLFLPLFVGFALWPATRQYFGNWTNKILNAVLLMIIVFAILAMALDVTSFYVERSAALPDGFAGAAGAVGLTFQFAVYSMLLLVVLVLFLLRAEHWAAALSNGAILHGGAAMIWAYSRLRR